MRVKLEWYEVDQASDVGRRRMVEAVRKKLSSAVRVTRAGKDEWTAHILGALGEMAFCKGTGRYWAGTVNTFKDADAGNRIQVRTRADHDHEMIVRERDADADVFVLVSGGPSEFIIRGWMLGEEAKQAEYKKNYGGYGAAYFVPANDLHSLDSLPIDS
jgi:hypothetical protein